MDYYSSNADSRSTPETAGKAGYGDGGFYDNNNSGGFNRRQAGGKFNRNNFGESFNSFSGGAGNNRAKPYARNSSNNVNFKQRGKSKAYHFR